jgi:hypothetical protein
MPKKIFRLSLEEKDFLDRVSAVSGYDKTIVRDVFQSFLNIITLELYSGCNTINIPYVCSLEIDSYEKIQQNGVETIVELQAIPSSSLIDEIKAVNEGDITPTQQYIRKQMIEKLDSIVNS